MQIKSTLLLLLIGIVIGVGVTRFYDTQKNRTVVQSDVLLEQIKQVAQVVTVEGHFSELMTQSSYEGSFGFLWDKKAIVQVRAKVSAGYDLEKMGMVMDGKRRVVRIQNLPKAKILSIDHQLAYYDIQEGLFESFTAQDHTQIQAAARQKIEEAAGRSGLLKRAEDQGNTLLVALKHVVEQAGWTLELPDTTFLLRSSGQSAR